MGCLFKLVIYIHCKLFWMFFFQLWISQDEPVAKFQLTKRLRSDLFQIFCWYNFLLWKQNPNQEIKISFSDFLENIFDILLLLAKSKQTQDTAIVLFVYVFHFIPFSTYFFIYFFLETSKRICFKSQNKTKKSEQVYKMGNQSYFLKLSEHIFFTLVITDGIETLFQVFHVIFKI